MAKKYAVLAKTEYEKLCNFDYGDLYSVKNGSKHTFFGKYLQIFTCVNHYGRLYIKVNFYPEGGRAFNFDCLDEAIEWAKSHVEVAETKTDGGDDNENHH